MHNHHVHILLIPKKQNLLLNRIDSVLIKKKQQKLADMESISISLIWGAPKSSRQCCMKYWIKKHAEVLWKHPEKTQKSFIFRQLLAAIHSSVCILCCNPKRFSGHTWNLNPVLEEEGRCGFSENPAVLTIFLMYFKILRTTEEKQIKKWYQGVYLFYFGRVSVSDKNLDGSRFLELPQDFMKIYLWYYTGYFFLWFSD